MVTSTILSFLQKNLFLDPSIKIDDSLFNSSRKTAIESILHNPMPFFKKDGSIGNEFIKKEYVPCILLALYGSSEESFSNINTLVDNIQKELYENGIVYKQEIGEEYFETYDTGKALVIFFNINPHSFSVNLQKRSVTEIFDGFYLRNNCKEEKLGQNLRLLLKYIISEGHCTDDEALDFVYGIKASQESNKGKLPNLIKRINHIAREIGLENLLEKIPHGTISLTSYFHNHFSIESQESEIIQK